LTSDIIIISNIVDMEFEIRTFDFNHSGIPAELLTDFSYANFTVSCRDALNKTPCSHEHYLVQVTYFEVTEIWLSNNLDLLSKTGKI